MKEQIIKKFEEIFKPKSDFIDKNVNEGYFDPDELDEMLEEAFQETIEILIKSGYTKNQLIEAGIEIEA